MRFGCKVPSFPEFPPHLVGECIVAVGLRGDFFWDLAPCRRDGTVSNGALRALNEAHTCEVLDSFSQLRQFFGRRWGEVLGMFRGCCALESLAVNLGSRFANLADCI